MAITITTLQGTNSLSADRITLNDNFKINTDAINNILSIVDTTTGLIDNTGVSTNNVIKTEGLTTSGSANNGIEVQTGNINITAGSFKATTNGSFLELGADNSKIIDTVLPVGTGGPSPSHIIGATGFIGIQISEMTTTERTAVTLTSTSPKIITFDTTDSKFYGWNGTAWTELG
tara:strand:+ start:271 stop:795 length:525 start_codon:yes stop_codon:yes gene_type:complete